MRKSSRRKSVTGRPLSSTAVAENTTSSLLTEKDSTWPLAAAGRAPSARTTRTTVLSKGLGYHPKQSVYRGLPGLVSFISRPVYSLQGVYLQNLEDDQGHVVVRALGSK